MSYKISSASHIALAYALNSRKENTDVYFVKTTLPNNTILNNNDLGLTRSHHLSFLSHSNHNIFYIDRYLANKGAARNYGIDLTLERYLKNGLYAMFTATLFKSEYRDAQGQWHNSRHDRRYITNILGGKEYTSLTFPNIAYRIEY